MTIISPIGFWSSLIGAIGSVILFFCAIPALIDTGGKGFLLLEQEDHTEKAKIVLYKRWARFGIACIVASYLLQLCPCIRL